MSGTSRPLRGSGTVLAVVFITTLMMSAGTNMLNIAAPAVTTAFQASAVAATVMLMAYSVMNTMLIIPAGQVADVLDRRAVFLIGLALYTVVTVLIGFSPTIVVLIMGRAIQGVAAAMLMSSAVSILMLAFPPKKLTGAMGVYLAGFSLGQVTGPMIGGVIATALGWQWLFWAVAPVTLLALLLGLWAFRGLPAPTRKPGSRRSQLDLPGSLLLALLLGGAQMALSLSGTLGLTSPVVLTIIVLVVVLIPVLRVVERRVANPVLHPELFARRDFPVALLQGFLVMLPRVGAVTAVGLYFQGMHGDSAAVAAVKTVTFPVLLTVGSLTGGRVRNLLSNRTATIVSAVVAAVGMAVMLLSVPLASDLLVIIGLGILGLGNGVFQTLNSSTIVTSAPKERASVVNAIRSTGQTFSTGIGLALAMALILAFAAADQGAAFMAGNPAGLSADGRAAIDLGFSVTYAVMLVLMLTGVALSWVRPSSADQR
ncbi:MFS transporter [Granulicoccus phenolivorans]|uniref:MFS transporter n=1 Tax=Granulicoccus phenolivorans TaxID=266854 RepID=UPI0004151158|nr:MFS transporter [Granulicoccus phenolivorans]